MTDALRLDAVSFRYPQDGCGLAPVSLRLQQGEALLISGVSGSGKSTLARLASGLIPHLYHGDLQGKAYLFGDLISDLPLWKISERAGLVFQNPAAQMLTTSIEEEIIFGLENLGLSRNEIIERTEAALERFQLTEYRQRPPQTLSGGEQQKLALACMLARQTPLLIFDEPLSMLDSTAARDLVGHLAALKDQGHTLLLCEHRQAFLKDLPGLHTYHFSPQEIPAGPEALPDQAGRLQEPFTFESHGLQVQRGPKTVINGMDFSLAGGQFVALIGRNGSGKTTLLRAIAGLQPFVGSLKVLTGRGEQAPRFGMVFQNPDAQLFQASVRAEVLFNLHDPDMDWYRWLLRMLELERYEEKPPLLLSEGEKRRVCLATALMNRSMHGLLLDEPSLGQDPQHKTIMLRLIKQLSQAGYLVLIATHDLELAASADRLLLLSAGGLLAQGAPQEIYADRSLWQRMGLWLPEWVSACPDGERIC